mgnify:CR=1 FL=1
MEWMNNLVAIFTVLIGSVVFYYIFRSIFSEFLSVGLLKTKDWIFLAITVFLVFIIYFFLETLHH